AKTRKKVLVAGGGPAGMEAAKTAAERGHDVVLCEAARELGGMLIPASKAPHK
ncbi:MAG: FAD-dependent oxidoreductase, partial [Akkermansiaceae bacterium]|nr:FAD-dependent oxidoreductase [Akkermansiaceae bacterium]